MQKNIIKIGIMPLKAFQKRTIDIAKGLLKPSPDDPKIWFPSIQSLAQVLSEENQQLLKLILAEQPQSVKALESLTNRKANNLLRTLRTMENYGLVKLEKGVGTQGRAPLIPKVSYRTLQIELTLQL